MRVNFKNISLREMREEDLELVLEIERLSFSTPWSRGAFLGEIHNSPFSHCFVVEEKKRVIGYIIYWVMMDEAHINNIALHPDFRGKGIGKFVLEFIIERIKQSGGKFITLEVRPSNIIARKLYEKLGFQIKGVRRNYYYNPKEDALVLIKYL